MSSSPSAEPTSVVITGAAGSIGVPLCEALTARGYLVTVVSRNPVVAATRVAHTDRYVLWTGDAGSEEMAAALDGSGALVHLAGPPLFAGRVNRTRADSVTADKIASTKALAAMLDRLRQPPRVWLNASSQGFYGFNRDPAISVSTEEDPAGTDHWAVGNRRWEEAAHPVQQLGVRLVSLRTGVYLSYRGGPLAGQLAQFRRGWGAWLGSGNGAYNWIHQTDAIGLITWALENHRVSGPLNLTAPTPVTSRQFAETLGQILGKPPRFGIPTPLLRVVLGATADIVTHSHPVLPAKALQLGYQFQFDQLQHALQDLLALPAPGS